MPDQKSADVKKLVCASALEAIKTGSHLLPKAECAEAATASAMPQLVRKGVK